MHYSTVSGIAAQSAAKTAFMRRSAKALQSEIDNRQGLEKAGVAVSIAWSDVAWGFG
jgi:hypothetical protein